MGADVVNGTIMDSTTFFKCLSDSTRLRIINLLHSRGELCVCELMQATGESQPKISRHLAHLRNCRLLQDERRGQWVFYRIHSELPDWAQRVIQQASLAETGQLQQDLSNIACQPTSDCR